MATETKKLRFLRAQGDPGKGGGVIPAGATIDIPEPFASQFVKRNVAVEVEKAAAKPKADKKK